jgi:hypothetical protein
MIFRFFGGLHKFSKKGFRVFRFFWGLQKLKRERKVGLL